MQSLLPPPVSSMLELQLVPFSGSGSLQRPGREFQDRLGSQANGNPPRPETLFDFKHAVLPAQECHIDGKTHAEGMNCLTGHEPQSFSRFQAGTAEQPRSSRGTRLRYIDMIAQLCTPGHIPDAQLLPATAGEKAPDRLPSM
jgi:hypothetical protein